MTSRNLTLSERRYRECQTLLYSVVYRILECPSLAEDCCQDAWLFALQSADRFRGDSRFTTWLCRIGINRALSMRRSSVSRTQREAEWAELRPRSVSQQNATSALMTSALSKLPPKMRQTLLLHDVWDYTHREAAAMMGVTEGTSRSQLFEARSHLKHALSGNVNPKRGRKASVISSVRTA